MNEKNEKLLKLLHTAFEQEYNDTVHYLKEAGLFAEKIAGGEKLADVFRKFSSEELLHADRIAGKIIALGGRPQWTFRPIDPERSLHKVLENHLGGEAEAYKLYTELIESCGDADFVLILKGIREDEKEHLEKVKHILQHLK